MQANWPAPKNISAMSTTRLCGFSQAPYDSNNLALHVGDNPEVVQKNRQQLIEMLHLPNEPVWLEQTHSPQCIIAEKETHRKADASVTQSYKHPLVILTADCLPIVLASMQGNEIAAIHAGWRGLCQGIIESTLNKMTTKPQDLLAWLGPSICRSCFEVGDDVFDAFTKKYPSTKSAFKARHQKWLADLPQLADIILKSYGILGVYHSKLCTYELESELFSYRRASQTGRIGTFIWFNDEF